MQNQAKTTVDAEEIERFSRIAEEWWDIKGKFAPLHRINPLRVEYIRRQAGGSLEGLNLLDIGCGGGLIAEPMARLGVHVTAIDASEKNIKVAQLHAKQSELAIDYRCTTAETLAEGGTQYDIVLALEIIEHVADIALFTASAAKLVKPGGLLIMSTLNRTAKSYALAIVGTEYILRWLPVGTHTWHKFLKPHELVREIEKHGLTPIDLCGMVMHPLTFEWRLDAKDLSVNYLVSSKKPD